MSRSFKGRREDHRLITGQGRFTGDWSLPGQLYGHFLRADRAHAEIVSLDVEAARAAPGVRAVLTGEDVRKAGFKQEPPLVRYPGRGGMKLLEPHRDALAVGRVRHVGQEVALVVADSPGCRTGRSREDRDRIPRPASDRRGGRRARSRRAAASREHPRQRRIRLRVRRRGQGAGRVRPGRARHARHAGEQAPRRQPDGAEGLPRRVRRRDRDVRPLRAEPGHDADARGIERHPRPPGREDPPPRARRRRRVRRALGCVLRVLRA